MVIKRKPKKKNQSTNNLSNDNNLEMNNASATTSKQSKPKERDTGMEVVEGALVNADPLLKIQVMMRTAIMLIPILILTH